MRIVADTNVLVSALVFPGGTPDDVYRGVADAKVTLVISRPLLLELGRVLGDKFGWPAVATEDAIGELLKIGELVEPGEVIRDVDADPSDDRVLEAAAAGQVDAIVTGDRHLLRLGTWRDIAVLTPAVFLELMSGEADVR